MLLHFWSNCVEILVLLPGANCSLYHKHGSDGVGRQAVCWRAGTGLVSGEENLEDSWYNYHSRETVEGPSLWRKMDSTPWPGSSVAGTALVDRSVTEEKTRSNSTFVLRKVLFKMSMQKWPIM